MLEASCEISGYDLPGLVYCEFANLKMAIEIVDLAVQVVIFRSKLPQFTRGHRFQQFELNLPIDLGPWFCPIFGPSFSGVPLRMTWFFSCDTWLVPIAIMTDSELIPDSVNWCISVSPSSLGYYLPWRSA